MTIFIAIPPFLPLAFPLLPFFPFDLPFDLPFAFVCRPRPDESKEAALLEDPYTGPTSSSGAE